MLRLLVAGAMLTLASPAPAAEPPGPDVFERTVAPFLETHCVGCHDEALQEGDFRVDTLGPGFEDREDAARWEKVFDRVSRGEMPLKRKRRPSPAEAASLLDWVNTGLKDEGLRRHRSEGRAQRRRLNRSEYENTLRDLLGADVRVASLLPEDGRVHGFDTVDEALSLSAVQMEKYLEATTSRSLRPWAATPLRPSSDGGSPT
jgi:mono/diheme cytochrome c family protein